MQYYNISSHERRPLINCCQISTKQQEIRSRGLFIARQTITSTFLHLGPITKTTITINSAIILNLLTLLLIHTQLVFSLGSTSSSKISDINCEIIQPMLFIDHSDHQMQSFRPLSVGDHCPDNLETFIRSSNDDEFVIDLVKNKRLISDTYFKYAIEKVDNLGQAIDQGQFISLHNHTTNEDHCHYHGLVNGNLNSTSAISIVHSRLLSGFFHDDHSKYSYYLEADTKNDVTLMRRAYNQQATIFQEEVSSTTCTYQLAQSGLKLKLNTRHKRDSTTVRRTRSTQKRRRFLKSNPDNKVLQQPFQSNSSTLYVQLLVVHDHSQYKDYDGNSSLIAERTMQIVNIMNAFYRQLNIFVALVGVVLWTEKDEIVLTDDGDATLTNFLKYRYEKLLPRFHHDNAQLITSTSFNGSVVGKALKGPICTHDHSGGVNTDHSHNAAIVAVTLAHELGHNLGMEHDEESCECPDEKCIMSSSSSQVHPKHWSLCSYNYLAHSRKHGLLDCLRNEPIEIFGPICGNGFVEEGEDCDIGELIPLGGTSKSRKQVNIHNHNWPDNEAARAQVTNPCCDRRTCKFVGNATCAQGACCDLSTCSVYNGTDTKVCRPRRNECDLEEVCDGNSEHCPPDVHYHDGLECGPTVSLLDGSVPAVNSDIYNHSRAFCYQGQCSSRESQCQRLWHSGATTSRDICYEQNVHGNTSGNCGYDRREKKYASCEPDDAICGMLHCVHNQQDNSDSNRKTGHLEYGFEAASILTVSFFVMSNHAKIYCHGAIIDAGPYMRDPGLVPNGAACGDQRMCLNQKCVSIQDVLQENWCPSDCNGNGICDNRGVCHCNDGTIGTSCYQFFGPNFHLSLVLYMITFFGPMIVLIALAVNHYRKQIKIWWFLHQRKIALTKRAREPSQQRRLAYNVDGHKVSISEPIPLSQQNNLNKPFFDPLMDPWADTSSSTNEVGKTGGVKSPGYRLELLKTKQQLPPPPPVPDYSTPNSSVPSAATNNLKPVRSAPPPPVPPHRQAPNARR